jgi:putative DNA primase/helicase
LLSTVGRGAFEIAPINLLRAPSAGSGKSYVVDIISTVSTGRWCPVISLSGPKEEIEKRLGALLLEGVAIVSLDNLTQDLQGELLCQMTERPIVKVRVLGMSKTPEIEWRGSLFATGNNVKLIGDMTRRGITANLDTQTEDPERREFKNNPIAMLLNNRSKYLSAALTIMRAYFVNKERVKCLPIASYEGWSRFVREPLIWLGERDVVDSMEENKKEDPVRNAAKTFLQEWVKHFGTERTFKVDELIDIAMQQQNLNGGVFGFSYDELRSVLMDRAGVHGTINPTKLGLWFRSIKGQVHDGLKLVAVSASQGHGNRWQVERLDKKVVAAPGAPPEHIQKLLAGG